MENNNNQNLQDSFSVIKCHQNLQQRNLNLLSDLVSSSSTQKTGILLKSIQLLSARLEAQDSSTQGSTLLLKTRIEHVKKGVKLQLQGKFHTSSSFFQLCLLLATDSQVRGVVHQRCTAELRIETTKVSCLREHCNDSVTLMTQLELHFFSRVRPRFFDQVGHSITMQQFYFCRESRVIARLYMWCSQSKTTQESSESLES